MKDYLIVGLGNPGAKYELTRHNAGFLVVDRLAKINNVKFKSECNALCGVFKLQGNEGNKAQLILAKPLTYMNLSGSAVFSLIKKYALPLSRVIIVYDDFSLPFGVLRLRSKGSSGGHKGLSSILSKTGADLGRLKIGIGAPPEGIDVPDYVLSKFSITERKMLPEVTSVAADAVITWAREGTEKAMNIYNGMIPSLREYLELN